MSDLIMSRAQVDAIEVPEANSRLLDGQKMATQQPTTAPIATWHKLQVQICGISGSYIVSGNFDYDCALNDTSQLGVYLLARTRWQAHCRETVTYSFVLLNHLCYLGEALMVEPINIAKAADRITSLQSGLASRTSGHNSVYLRKWC